MTAATSGFRPEIQGLRAIAIMAVVAFHALPDAVPGGYAGVDVFFVISGYLITGTLMRDIAARRYSLPNFYARRIARLFPALFVMLAVVAAGALAILPPAHLPGFLASLTAASAFVANIYFGREVGYFAEAAELQLLLHTWSLSIEEQFYIVYPLLLVALMRLGRAVRAPVLLACLLASLSVAIRAEPLGVLPFYSPLTRAYELLIGCLLAIRFDTAPRSRAAAGGEVLVGAGLILGAFVLFAPGQEMPGWHALIPCLGCALIIHGGRNAPAELMRPLKSRPARFFGDISYSLYLWHWPVLVFARLLSLGELSRAQLAGCLVLSVLLAWASFRFVERPVLKKSWSARVALPIALMLVTVAALPRATGLAADGWPERFSPAALQQFADKADYSPLRPRCHMDFHHPASYADRCVLGGKGPADTLIWADSTGVEISQALAVSYEREGRSLRQATGSSCPPLLNDRRFGESCLRFNREILRGVAADPQVRLVVLSGYYSGYQRFGSADASSSEVARAVTEAAVRLREAGKRVIILLPLPDYAVPVPEGLGIATKLGLATARKGVDADGFAVKRREATAVLAAAARRSGARLVDPAAALCDQHRCRVSGEGGAALYFDRVHPSLTGAALITAEPALTDALELPRIQ